MPELEPGEKSCPYCAETIKAAAVKCRFCQSDLTGSASPAGSTGPSLHKEPEPAPPAAGEDSPPAPALAPHEWTIPEMGRDSSAANIPFLASFRLLGILVALCLVLAAVTGYAWYRSEHPAEGKAPNGVITSSEARDAGMEAAAQLTTKVLSYDWKTLDADIKGSEAVLAPSFRTEYAKTMNGVKAQTIKNQVKLVAAVAATSIVSATDRKVKALVFVNQSTTAKGAGNQRLDQNRVLVTLTRDGGEWRVSKMDAF